MPTYKILGGHGRVALLIAQELAKGPNNRVISFIRDKRQFQDISILGAEPQLLDIENATVSDFAAAFKGADFVIWSAGAGGKGGSQRTYAIDRDAAIRSMQAAREVPGITRYIMVSYLGSNLAPQMDPSEPLYHYGQAKNEADIYLRERSGLNYTVVNPGPLSNDKGSGKVDFEATPQDTSGRAISRANVARVITTLLTDEIAFTHTLGKEIGCLDGITDILEGLRSI